MGYGRLDRDLSPQIVTRLIDEQFPGLAGQPVRWLAAGWDNELFSVGGDWILRFPKRAERVPWLTREIEIMAVVADALGRLVPRFELIGRASAAGTAGWRRAFR
jgi:aminoglycoside phosphotransferase (APT) family kinase protein